MQSVENSVCEGAITEMSAFVLVFCVIRKKHINHDLT